MDTAWIGIIVVNIIYLIGLIIIFRKRCSYKEDKRRYRLLVLWSMLGGVVIIILWVSKFVLG